MGEQLRPEAPQVQQEYPPCVMLVSEAFRELNAFWKDSDKFSSVEKVYILRALERAQFEIYPKHWESYKKLSADAAQQTELGMVANRYFADRYIIQLINEVFNLERKEKHPDALPAYVVAKLMGALYNSREIIINRPLL